MPNWQPNWNDVVWDHQASSAAATALCRAADEVERAARQRAAAAAQATAAWLGGHRLTFGDELGRLQRAAAELAALYRDAASRVGQAAARAAEEQRRRERERERWRDERDEEERRERQRRPT